MNDMIMDYDHKLTIFSILETYNWIAEVLFNVYPGMMNFLKIASFCHIFTLHCTYWFVSPTVVQLTPPENINKNTKISLSSKVIVTLVAVITVEENPARPWRRSVRRS